MATEPKLPCATSSTGQSCLISAAPWYHGISSCQPHPSLLLGPSALVLLFLGFLGAPPPPGAMGPPPPYNPTQTPGTGCTQRSPLWVQLSFQYKSLAYLPRGAWTSGICSPTVTLHTTPRCEGLDCLLCLRPQLISSNLPICKGSQLGPVAHSWVAPLALAVLNNTLPSFSYHLPPVPAVQCFGFPIGQPLLLGSFLCRRLGLAPYWDYISPESCKDPKGVTVWYSPAGAVL